MKIIGLCGGSGSGKGTVCKIFSEFGIPSVDTDAVYRELTSSPGDCLIALANEFGSEIITERGALNRKLLAQLVFSGENSSERLSRLNEISHKFILDETRRRLQEFKKSGAPFALVDAPALFESGFDRECDGVVCVLADRKKRVERIMSRDSLTRNEAEERISAQLSDAELISLSDYVIHNDSDVSALTDEVKAILHKILDNN